MNTDQAFELLKEAGVTEEAGIQTVRRWLRERKINYEGNGNRKTGFIMDNTDEAISMLKDAGVDEGTGLLVVRRWLKEGKIQSVGTGNRKTEYIANNSSFNSQPARQDKMIRQLEARIKAQDEHIKGLENLHQTSIKTLIQQRDNLIKEISDLENEKNEFQKETMKLLKENFDLRHEVLKLKEELSKGNNGDSYKEPDIPPLPMTNDYRQKLGLSKSASHKEVLAGYKKLLKITHPDHGGNAAVFHYIKTEYDFYKNSINH